MAIIATEGFDKYSNKANVETGLASRWSIGGNSVAGTLVTGHFGVGKAIQYNNPTGSNLSDRLDLGANYLALGVSFTFLPETVAGDWGTAGTGEQFFSFLDSAGAEQCQLTLDPAGNIHLRRGTTVIASTTAGSVVSALTTAFLEMEIGLSDSTGTFKLWANNVLVMDASGLDNKNTANNNIRFVALAPGSALDTYCEFDNLIVTDGARPGYQKRVITLSPTSDTADKDFVASSGVDNFAVVDETPLNTTDYVQGTNVGDLDLYGFEDLPANFSIIDAVSLVVVAAKSDVASRELRGVIKSGSSTAATPNLALNAAYKPVRSIVELNPDGSVAWTAGAVNAITAGPEIMV